MILEDIHIKQGIGELRTKNITIIFSQVVFSLTPSLIKSPQSGQIFEWGIANEFKDAIFGGMTTHTFACYESDILLFSALIHMWSSPSMYSYSIPSQPFRVHHCSIQRVQYKSTVVVNKCH